MNKKMTHIGNVIYHNKTYHNILLRETKKFWITDHGCKYRKQSGMPANETWPTCVLDINSIKPINPE